MKKFMGLCGGFPTFKDIFFSSTAPLFFSKTSFLLRIINNFLSKKNRRAPDHHPMFDKDVVLVI
jgi:hypothetical protein